MQDGLKGEHAERGHHGKYGVSATEAALENQRIGGLQFRVAVLCTLVQICDGYDINSVAWAGPSLIKAWHLPAAAFTMAFPFSSIGILVGALSAGPIGDRFGRRPLLLVSLTIFGVASLLSATADLLGALTFWRFFTGIGIGGGFSGAAALAGDYAPHRLRATMIMASFTGAPIGGFVGGQIVAALLVHHEWPVIFILGGAFPLVLVVALALWLPESPRFLAKSPLCQRAMPPCCGASTFRRRTATRLMSLRAAAWSGCFSAMATPCRPYCCGSFTSAAC